MMGGAVAHWLVGEQCVGEKQREQIREECGMVEGIVQSSHQTPLSFFHSPFLVLHPN